MYDIDRYRDTEPTSYERVYIHTDICETRSLPRPFGDGSTLLPGTAVSDKLIELPALLHLHWRHVPQLRPIFPGPSLIRSQPKGSQQETSSPNSKRSLAPSMGDLVDFYKRKGMQNPLNAGIVCRVLSVDGAEGFQGCLMGPSWPSVSRVSSEARWRKREFIDHSVACGAKSTTQQSFYRIYEVSFVSSILNLESREPRTVNG